MAVTLPRLQRPVTSGKARLRRYLLGTEEGAKAVAAGLAGGSDWFRSAVPRKRMKQLMQRTDERATRDTALWLGGMAACGAIGSGLLSTRRYKALAVPFLGMYGLLYGSASDSRWHEMGHGTAFKTRWKNDVVYQIACFMVMRDPTVWRWSHTRHHTDTLIVGRDPEIAVMRPARLAKVLGNLFALVDAPVAMRDMVLHASGRLTGGERTYIPDSEQARVYRTARIWAAIYAGTIATAVATRSWIPLLLVGLPRMYGGSLLVVYGVTQHAGMGENVLDHRLNTRTVHMNRFNRFMYSNMNYHVEHHMFPMVPYHRLPELHEEIKHDLAPAYPGIIAAYREIIPAILRQLRDETYYIRRELPEGAAPYHSMDDGRALDLPELPDDAQPAADPADRPTDAEENRDG
ncbi:MAG: fatty acid desaturase family protein [Actinomycetales bacterium]